MTRAAPGGLPEALAVRAAGVPRCGPEPFAGGWSMVPGQLACRAGLLSCLASGATHEAPGQDRVRRGSAEEGQEKEPATAITSARICGLTSFIGSSFGWTSEAAT